MLPGAVGNGGFCPGLLLLGGGRLDIDVELVGGSGECVVLVREGEKSWSVGFDLLTGDVDGLCGDLEVRMNRNVEGESPMMVLLRRRIAEAREKLRRGC